MLTKRMSYTTTNTTFKTLFLTSLQIYVIFKVRYILRIFHADFISEALHLEQFFFISYLCNLRYFPDTA